MMSAVVKTLGIFKKTTVFDSGVGALLPEAYKTFYKEWKLTEPTAVHYLQKENKWERNEDTGEVRRVENIPIPAIYPQESNAHIWGGEGIIQGFQKRGKYRRVPHFWMPHLKRSVVFSEILNKHISAIITNRTINLINSNYGFDHYLLKTRACDLKSLLPLTLKRNILKELYDGCPIYQNMPEKQIEIHERYKKYLLDYTREEIEWYGYSFSAACKKMEAIIASQKKIVPLKHIYRSSLIEELKTKSL